MENGRKMSKNGKNKMSMFRVHFLSRLVWTSLKQKQKQKLC